MKKSLIIMVLVALVSTDVYAKNKKNSSFGKWNYDKFGHASVINTNAIPVIRTGDMATDAYNICRQYIHIDTKFHVRVKNWFKYLQVGLNGYAEMRATLGTASKSCGIPYNVARMDIFYDRNKHRSVHNQSYIKATMRGIGAANECYQAIGYAFNHSGIILPNNYSGAISVTDTNDVIAGVPSSNTEYIPKYPYSQEITVRDVLNTYNEAVPNDYRIDVTRVPYVDQNIPMGWLLPNRTVGVNHAVSIKPYAGAIMNEDKGCYKVKFGTVTLHF